MRRGGLILNTDDNDLKYGDVSARQQTNDDTKPSMKRRLHHKQQPSSRETGYIHNHHTHTPTPVPLKPMVQLTWIDSHTLKMVLLEGKKRQIRRLCRDVLHVEVLRLERVGIGEIRIETLPVR